MRVIVIGSVESTRVCLETLRDGGAEVAAVVTLPRELSSRHSDFIDMAAEACALGIETIFAPDCNAPGVVERCSTLRPDYLFVVGWSQICRSPLLATARIGAIGYHPAPLPRMRGRAVIPWTILLDEKITGATLFWIERGVDSGPILAQRFFHVAPDETATTLYRRHMKVLAALVREAIPALESGHPPHLPQDERFATYCTKRTPADGRIDWSKPAVEIYRLVRAVTRPYPGAFTTSPRGRVIVWSALPSTTTPRIAALTGQVIERRDTSFAVRCGDGSDLWITDFASEGEDSSPPLLHSVLL